MTWSPLDILEDVSQAFLEAVAEEKPHVKPYFSKTIRDLEVVEGSAARFDCKIEGKLWPGLSLRYMVMAVHESLGKTLVLYCLQ